MTQHDQIVALARQGLDNGEIAQRVGCRREYVRTVRRRAAEKGQRRRKPTTLHSKIVALVQSGMTDAEVAARVSCRLEYVRVARRRAGLLRTEAPRRAALARAAERVKARIEALEAKLAAAQRQLRELLEG
jgi:DNA-binding CsgD family transcriptional regulator